MREDDDMRGANLKSLRQHNRATVLQALQRATGPIPLNRIKTLTGLSRPTIEAVLQTLIDEGLALEAGMSDTTTSQQGGRPARLFAFNPRAGALCAIVIGLDDVQVAVSDLSGTILGWRTTPVVVGEQRQDIALDRLRALMRTLDVPWESIRSVTVGIMGVHTTSGTILRNQALPEVSLPGYFASYAEAFDCPVHYVNDAYLAALAQYDELCDQSSTHSMIGLHVTTAIGCGILVRGELFQGFSGAAAEMGFDPATGWVKADQMLRSFMATHQIMPATVFQRAGAGHSEYVDFTRDFVTTALPGIRVLALAFDPQIFTIGGAITKAADIVGPLVCEALSILPSGGPEVRYSTLGEEAIITGALRAGVRDIEGSLESA